VVAVPERFERFGISDGTGFHAWGAYVSCEAPQPGSGIIATWVASCDPKPGGDDRWLVGILCRQRSERRRGNAGLGLVVVVDTAELGASPLILHHDGKSESARDYRGSSDFAPAIDIGFRVSNYGETGPPDKPVLRCCPEP
jgi:hypothetical protein